MIYRIYNLKETEFTFLLIDILFESRETVYFKTNHPCFLTNELFEAFVLPLIQQADEEEGEETKYDFYQT